ncbi:MAG: ABA4-like family protein [Pseudomonadota bacterium]
MIDQVFDIANTLALVGWIGLLASPFIPRVSALVSGLLIPLALSFGYVVVIAMSFGQAEGGFDTLENVMLLFDDPAVALGGWVHFLAFDLLIGAWIVKNARENGIPFWMVLPCLPLTFLFGPAGWLLYQLISQTRSRLGPTATAAP